jgi:hypothetical protein
MSDDAQTLRGTPDALHEHPIKPRRWGGTDNDVKLAEGGRASLPMLIINFKDK